MEIFHYVGNELLATPNFESEVTETTGPRIGAIYNDFDTDSPFTLNSTPSLQPSTSSNDIASLVSQEDLDFALLEADEHENIFSQYTAFDTENFDCTTVLPDTEYYQKVKHSQHNI